jgi:hypothetical protein
MTKHIAVWIDRKEARIFHDVAPALEGAEAILFFRPSTAKRGLLRYVHPEEQALEPRVVGIETFDPPTDGPLIAYAKKSCEWADPMWPGDR